MSNLLQKASIITTPTAYDTGKILSVKPVQTYGPELITNGDFATDSDWSKQTGWTISGGKANSDGTIDRSLFQANVFTIGKSYKISFSISDVTGSLNARIWMATGGPKIEVTSEGNYIIDWVADGTYLYITTLSTNLATYSISNVSVKEVLNADFDFSRNSSATRVGSNGLIQDVASNLPRIDYTGGVGSWKFEPQRTNLIIRSENYGHAAWSTFQSTILLSQNNTLTNQNDATLLYPSITSSYASLFDANDLTSGIYTFSVFAKASGKNFLCIDDTIGGKNWFNLSNGTLGTINSSYTANIENYSGGWYRCSVTNNSNATFNYTAVYLVTDTDNSLAITANGTDGILLFGSQTEAGSYPTSYIISNSGSATTRLADVANNAGSSDLINSTQGVLYAEISALADDGTFRGISLSDGTYSNRCVLRYGGSSNRVNVLIQSNGSNVFDNNFILTNIKDFNKIAVKWNTNNFSLFVNGNEVATNTSGAAPTGLSQLQFADSINNSVFFFGKTKSVAVFKEALTDLELECLVSWMSFSDLGINFGYTVE